MFINFRHDDGIRKEKAIILAIKGDEVWVESESVTAWLNWKDSISKREYVWLSEE